jgi:hypothetical protein
MDNKEKGIIRIETLQKVERDPSFVANGAVLIRFMNKGQSRVMIDEQEVLEPGESFTEGDLSGPGIEHTYKIDFLTLSSPPAVDSFKTMTGNMLKVRFFFRKK